METSRKATMAAPAGEPVHLLEHPATTIAHNAELVGVVVAPAAPMPFLDSVLDDILEWGGPHDE
ncbi:MAG: hypothetical protein ACXWX4_07065 [Actinomycetota bacterium]